MYEENLILSQIEELVDKLPYRSVKIEVELEEKTLTLQKDRQRQIGFSTEVKQLKKKSKTLVKVKNSLNKLRSL